LVLGPGSCDIGVGIFSSCVFCAVFAVVAIRYLLFAINLPSYRGELVSASVDGDDDYGGIITEQFMYFPDGRSHNTTFRYCAIRRAKVFSTMAAADAVAQNISVGSFRTIWLGYFYPHQCMDYPIIHTYLIVGLVFLCAATSLFAVGIHFMRLHRIMVKEARARRVDPEMLPTDESELDSGLK
jgi:hypothetical protein